MLMVRQKATLTIGSSGHGAPPSVARPPRVDRRWAGSATAISSPAGPTAPARAHFCRRTLARQSAGLAAIVGVNGDIIVRQIAGPNRCRCGADANVGANDDLPIFHVVGHHRFDVLGRPLAIARDLVGTKADRELVAIGR